MPPYQYGQFEGTKRHISKRGSRSLRKCGYEVMMAIKSAKPAEDHAVYEYMLKKEAEGKNKKLVKIAELNKFFKNLLCTSDRALLILRLSLPLIHKFQKDT